MTGMNGSSRRAFVCATAAAAATAALPLSATTAAATTGNRYALQRRFADWRFGMFLHFNMGTFHDAEWVDPNQDPLSASAGGRRSTRPTT